MPYFAYFSNLDFSARQQTNLQQRVTMMRWSRYGGYDVAELQAFGDFRAVGDLIDLLRCPVEIWDEHGDRAWLGITNSVSYMRGSIRITFSLDLMYNKIAVAYSWIEPGTQEMGVRKTTAYTTDADSVTFFGTKELLYSSDGQTDASALEIRDNLLTQLKYPLGTPSGEGGGTPAIGACMAPTEITIGLKGLWHTLGWTHVTVPLAVYIDYVGGTASNPNIGDAAGRAKGRQTFTIATNAVQIVKTRAILAKVGSPTDNLVLELYATDGAGNPTGSALASLNVAGASLTTTLTAYDLTFTAGAKVAPGLYAVQYSRSGAVNASNYFQLAGYSTSGYAGGDWKIHDGTNWGADGAVLDVRLKIITNNLVETSQQIKEHVVGAGQFLDTGNTLITDTSGIYTGSQRDGETTALAEILALMEMGYSDGSRMVAKVTKERVVEISKSPASAAYKVDSYNRIYDVQTNDLIRVHQAPVGNWLELADLLPETADTSRLITPGRVFLEAYEWRDGVTTPIYANQDDLQGALRV